MPMKIKICGMREPMNIQEVASLSPDYMGFVFYQQSPRYVGEHLTMPDISIAIQRVGVFVNAKKNEMVEAANTFGLDYLQLHGTETPQQCEALRKDGYKLIKAFGVNDDFDFNAIVPYEPFVDFVLFDTKGKYYGGNATSFDWRNLDRYNQAKPFFLSGGLSEQNLASVKSLLDMNLHALDLNSGVESRPGVKDIAMIRSVKNILNTLS
jgi:phosphoribosylanthranilate isomerase